MAALVLILMAVLVILVTVLLVIWVTLDRMHLAYLGVGALCSALFAVFWLPDFLDFSRDMAILQAGLSELNIHHVFGIGNHYCVTCSQAPWLMEFLGSDRLPIQNIVIMNRVLYVMNVGAMVTAGLAITGSLIWPVFFMAGFVGVPIIAIGSNTNYPAAPVMTLFLSGLLSAAIWNRRREAGTLPAILSVVTLAVLTVVAYLTRPETAVLGLAALAGLLAAHPMARRLLDRSWLLVRNILRMPVPGRPAEPGSTAFFRRNWFVAGVVAVLVMVAMEVASNSLGKGDFPVWLIDGLNPMNPSTANVVFHLVLLLPLSIAALCLAGLVDLFRRPVAYLLLPLSMAFLLKTYSSASRYDLHTLFRMYCLLLPMVMVLAMWGLRRLNGLLGRTIPDVRVRLLVAALIIASFSINTPFVRKAARTNKPPEGYIAGLEERRTWLSMNPQLEVRFLLDVLDKNPDCLIHTKAISTGSYNEINAGRGEGLFEDLWFSREGILDGPPAANTGCVLFYRSLDCNLLGRHACDQQLAGMEPVREISFSSRPYGDYLLVRYAEPVVLGIYRAAK